MKEHTSPSCFQTTCWEEIWYYPSMATEFSRTDMTGETMTLNLTMNDMEREHIDALTSQDGPLAAGALPSLNLAVKEGEKSLAESLCAGSVAKVKTTKRPKESATEVKATKGKEILSLSVVSMISLLCALEVPKFVFQPCSL